MTDDSDRSSRAARGLGRGAALIESTFRRLSSLLPGFIRRNYLLKFGLALLIIVLLITVVGLVAINETTETLDTQVSQQLQTETQRETEDVKTWRQQRVRWLTEVAKARQFQSDKTDPIGAYLQFEVQNVPDDVRFVYFINRTSKEILASNVRRVEGQYLNETNAPWADKPLQFTTANEVFVSDVYRDEGLPVIAYATQVPERPDFALVAISRSQYPITKLDNKQPARFVTVIDRNGTIVMDSRGHENVGKQYAPENTEDLIRRAANQSSGFLRTAPNQKELPRDHVAAFASTEGTDIEKDWIVITHAAEEQVYLIRSEIIQNLILMLLISLVGLAVIGLVIAGGTVWSINRLARKVKEFEEGNLDVEVSSRREDEIGQLYDGFDSMRQTLQQRIEELSEAIQAEEQMRKELSETNRDLKDQRIIISVLNRLLRHNLRNSLTSILLRTEKLSEQVPEKQQAEVDEIFSVTERLMQRVEKSQAIEKIIDTDSEELAAVDMTEIVDDVVEIHRGEFPSASITTTMPETAYVKGGEGLSFIVDNLLENALEHNDQSDPHAWITIQSVTEDGAQWIELLVEDDGPGIPEMEIEVLESGEETPLEHGSGIGLWLINWLVNHMNGELEFEEREPRGTRIRIRFPEPDESALQLSRAYGAAD